MHITHHRPRQRGSRPSTPCARRSWSCTTKTSGAYCMQQRLFDNCRMLIFAFCKREPFAAEPLVLRHGCVCSTSQFNWTDIPDFPLAIGKISKIGVTSQLDQCHAAGRGVLMFDVWYRACGAGATPRAGPATRSTTSMRRTTRSS
jgi:hypothetical protein